MDDLADSLATSFQVTSHPNNPAAPHPRFSDYKKRPGFTDQMVRRQRLLERQKRFVKRFICTTVLRNEEIILKHDSGLGLKTEIVTQFVFF